MVRRIFSALTYARAVMLIALVIPSSSQVKPLLAKQVRNEVLTGQVALTNLLPASQRMRLAINLPLRNEADLYSFLQALYDPTGPAYHKYLTVSQFADDYSATPQDYDAVINWAKSKGFNVTSTSPSRRMVHIEGSVETINKAFNITMGTYRHPTEDRDFFSPDREPTVDAPVDILQITGLDNFYLPHTSIARKRADSQPRPDYGTGPGGYYLPSNMRTAYYGSGTLTGQYQSVGILSLDGYLTSDLTLFYSAAGIPKPSTTINNYYSDGFNGACSANGSGSGTCDDTEQIADIVQANGMAPQLYYIDVYEGSNYTYVLEQMASYNSDKVLTSSWFPGSTDKPSDDTYFLQFQAQGQTFLTASGDCGAFSGECAADRSHEPAYYYPATDPNITVVGATDLSTSGAGGPWLSETGWSNCSPSYSLCSGGGYVSGTGIPSYQSQSPILGEISNAGGSTTLRNSPDISADGNTDSYYVDNGATGGGLGGTSLAAPRWAGLIALGNQLAASESKAPIGFLNPYLYTIASNPTKYANDFHDITSGNNIPPSGGSGFYATTGYDLVTGLGSPQGANLLNDIVAMDAYYPWDFSLKLPYAQCSSPGNLSFNLQQSGNANSTSWVLTQTLTNVQIISLNWTVHDGQGTILTGGNYYGAGVTYLTASRAPVGTPTLSINGSILQTETGCDGQFQENVNATN
jgi:subtilase family serine protease